MYRQILVTQKDSNLQRILWRENLEQDVKHYALRTVTYGTTSASFLATRCLVQIVNDNNDQFPNACRAILNDFYVDDLIAGADSVHEIKQLKIDSIDAQTDSSFFDEDPLSLSIKKEIKHETERTEHLIAPVAMTDDKPTTSRQSLDPQTSDSVLEENPLSLPIKKEKMHESVQEEHSFVHLSKTDDGLTIFKQSMDAQTDSSFFDEDPLSLSIKKEIKHETERTEHLIAPVAMTDDKPTTSRQVQSLTMVHHW
ncbi:uncharacterized protein LOC142332947 [Lycorma delicatula]|uniref:uncharacterized protein LOC142332947 n=1 Tax=Lycorma delicatula TaxID=130591 RepID=UPI003F5193A2